MGHGGNGDGVFTIDAATGQITVDDNTSLDRETTASYNLIVTVTDGTNSDTAAITVNVTDVNEHTPVAADATFAVSEDAVRTAMEGTVPSTQDHEKTHLT